jgi:hypothetical protein
VNRLTKHEQLVLCIMVGLLLTGWTVKAYRAAHPPLQTFAPAEAQNAGRHL